MNGSLAFKKPKRFAKMLGIDVYVVMHVKAVLAVINHKKVDLCPDQFKAFCDSFLDFYYQNDRLNWNFQNTTVSHSSENQNV